MKKLLIVLGIFFSCIIVIITVVSLIGVHYGPKFDKSSKAYVDEVVPIILVSWNPQELARRAHPELLKALPNGEPATLFRKLSESLGAFKTYEGSAGESHANLSFVREGLKVGINATYVVRAAFQKGNAEIKIDLNRDRDGKWKITGFFVKPLMPVA